MSDLRRFVMLTVLSAVLVVTASSARAQSGSEWPMYGGDYANTRYSTLNQINTGNVSRLRVRWIRSLGSLESQEATPIVVGDTMYVSTSTGPKYVFALNAKDGTVKWKYEPEIPQDAFATVCCGLDSRGVAYANGKVFVTRLDAKLVALDANTGKELWTVTVVDYKVGHAITSPPVLYKNLVVTGYAGGEYGVRGAVQAYNQNTGDLVWKTYTVPGTGKRHLEGRLVEDGRRVDVVRRLLRSQAQPPLLGHEQRRALGRAYPQYGHERVRSIHERPHRVAARIQRRYREDRVGLSDDAG